MNPRITSLSLPLLLRIVSANNGVAIVGINIIDDNSDTDMPFILF